MKQERITINDRVLTASEVRTLRMAIGAFELQLHSDAASSREPVSGATDHLNNLFTLQELVGVMET